jgi:pilus assembly protein CpaB
MRRRILVLALAAVMALFSGIAVLAYAKGADRRALDGSQGKWVLLATGAIPAGTTIADIRSRKLTRQVLMPARTVPDGALGKLEDVTDGQALNAALQPDQMLLLGQFAIAGVPTASPTPSFTLPAGKNAVSVSLGMAAQVAGRVHVGDQVDVYMTYPREDTADRPQTTVLMLSKVTVLSVGETPEVEATPTPTPAASGTPASAPATTAAATTSIAGGLQRYVVTLAVSKGDGAKLITATNAGIVYLGLATIATRKPAPMPTPVTTP